MHYPTDLQMNKTVGTIITKIKIITKEKHVTIKLFLNFLYSVFSYTAINFSLNCFSRCILDSTPLSTGIESLNVEHLIVKYINATLKMNAKIN